MPFFLPLQLEVVASSIVVHTLTHRFFQATSQPIREEPVSRSLVNDLRDEDYRLLLVGILTRTRRMLQRFE